MRSAHETGSDVVGIKRPTFSFDDRFNCASFGVRFDFIIAQSIVTHCGPDLFRRLMKSAREALQDDGLILFSAILADDPLAPLPANGWHYPDCVAYTDEQLGGVLNEAGLHGTPIPWRHPGASWHVAALSPARLPSEDERRLLTGAVLFDPQFADSRIGLSRR